MNDAMEIIFFFMLCYERKFFFSSKETQPNSECGWIHWSGFCGFTQQLRMFHWVSVSIPQCFVIFRKIKYAASCGVTMSLARLAINFSI